MKITKEAFVVAAALIAGAFSLVSLILSKELKVSELRQQWIEALRDDITKYLSSITTLYKLAEAKLDSYIPPKNEFDEQMCSSFRDDHKNQYLELNETNNRIILRLNPKEAVHKKLMTHIKKNTKIFYDKKCKRDDMNNGMDLMKDISDVSQLIINKEWEKVKKGEFIFRFVLFIIFLIFAGYKIYNKIVT